MSLRDNSVESNVGTKVVEGIDGILVDSINDSWLYFSEDNASRVKGASVISSTGNCSVVVSR